MSVHDFIIQMLLLVITFALPIISAFTISLLKAKLGATKFDQASKIAEVAVKAIEQAMGAGNGAEKKREVELYLANKLKGVTTDDIDKLIEAGVAALNQKKKEATTNEQATGVSEN